MTDRRDSIFTSKIFIATICELVSQIMEELIAERFVRDASQNLCTTVPIILPKRYVRLTDSFLAEIAFETIFRKWNHISASRKVYMRSRLCQLALPVPSRTRYM